jgi:DNA-directed RNA polymerase II subunit RPB7
MFFLKEMRKDILLKPEDMGPDWNAEIKKTLFDELNGQCLGKHGYVVAVLGVDKIIPGIIDNDTGSAHFTIKYKVMLLRPFRHEVIDTVVTVASEEAGIFTKVGPLQIFVSRHSMPPEIQFRPLAENWGTEDSSTEIVSGSVLRVKIIGIAFEASSITAVGTINAPFLGQMR